MNVRRTSVVAALGLCSLMSVIAYRVGRARADGVPTTAPLYYGGVLDDGGRPVEGMRNVTIRLWDMASGGTAACTTVAPNTPFSAGRFRVEMDAACTVAVRANPDLWAEVLVDSTTFARSKLGAVPYALESGRAAGASGPLATRIASIEARAQPRQVEVGPAGGMVMFSGSPSGSSSELPVSGTTTTFTPRVTSSYEITSQCTVRGQVSLSVRALSSPNPTDAISQPASANTLFNQSNGYGYGTTTISVQYIGTMQAGTPYTIQLVAALTSSSYYSGSGSTQYWTTSSADCGRVFVKQLN